MTAGSEGDRLARRGRIQVLCAVVAGLLAVLAALVPTWIEEATALEPDGGSGELEWLLAAAFGVISVVLWVMAYLTRRRLVAIQPDPAQHVALLRP